MMYILTLLAAFFLILIVYLLDKIQRDKLKFESKIKILEDFIVHISKEQKIQDNQLLLTAELKQQLQTINATLNKDIFDLNYQLFEELQARK